MNPVGPNETFGDPPAFFDGDEPEYLWTKEGSPGPSDVATTPPAFVQYREGDFPNAAEIPVPNVSPLTAHWHLAVLRRFESLYQAVESTGLAEKDRARALQRFLVCAEARYIHYLSMLDVFFRQHGANKAQAHETMPLPPWDVAIVFHAHCLSPYRFYTDIHHHTRRHRSNVLNHDSAVSIDRLNFLAKNGVWCRDLAFPLERLNFLIQNGIWSHEKSQAHWDAMCHTPYQLWTTDPALGGELRLQDIQFTCAWCIQPVIIDLEQFTETHITKKAISVCPSCQMKFNADNISAQHLKRDFTEFVDVHDPWVVKGAISGSNQSTVADAHTDLIIILETVLNPQGARPTKTGLGTYLETDDVSWQGFIRAFRQTVVDLKSIRILRVLSRPGIFQSIRSSYMGILWHDLSIDLVAACLRQREFIKRITGQECSELDTPFALFKANTRYHKFLLLLNRKNQSKKKKINLVPTLDIDLCWHTHQLFPVAYRQWCIDQLGTTINHDDTIGRGDLAVGLRETSLAWFDAYRESYTTDDLRQTYLTTNRKIAGVLFPPYGLYALKKARKLDQARLVAGTGPSAPARGIRGIRGGQASYPYMYMFPYWTMFPLGWDAYPAACASGLAGIGGWGPGVGSCGGNFDGGNCVAGSCAGVGSFGAGGACGGGGAGCGGGGGNCGGGSGGNCGGGSGGCGGGGGGCGGGGGGGGGCGGGGNNSRNILAIELMGKIASTL